MKLHINPRAVDPLILLITYACIYTFPNQRQEKKESVEVITERFLKFMKNNSSELMSIPSQFCSST